MLTLHDVRMYKPSMEPQLFSCGLMPKTEALAQNVIHLQWSRNFSVADWIALPIINKILKALQWSRNFSVADCLTGSNPIASMTFPSMEPQLFSCGLMPKTEALAQNVIHLQWSRNFSVADWFFLFFVIQWFIFPSMEPQLFSCGLTVLQYQTSPRV